MKHLVIMARQPVAGNVKSRLARQIGVARATGLYRQLMTSTMHRLSRDRRWRTWAAVTPDISVFDYPWPSGVRVFGQGSGDLGTRMQRIFDTIPHGRPCGSVIIIGTDIPFITADDIADAFHLLDRNHMVFGSAGDGGYWLVGARHSPRIAKAFANVRWSGKHTLADTLENVKDLKIAFAREHYDIDTKADYLKWRKSQI